MIVTKEISIIIIAVLAAGGAVFSILGEQSISRIQTRDGLEIVSAEINGDYAGNYILSLTVKNNGRDDITLDNLEFNSPLGDLESLEPHPVLQAGKTWSNNYDIGKHEFVRGTSHLLTASGMSGGSAVNDVFPVVVINSPHRVELTEPTP